MSSAMKVIRSHRFCFFVTALLMVGLTGCAAQRSPSVVPGQPPEGLPYHPIVYHLDLSILAYQLYGQTLVWPFDPYYEESDARKEFMAKVRVWAEARGAEQVKRDAGLDGYRGPGVLSGFDDNDRHDPIVYRYGRLHPWSHTVTRSKTRWIEYLTPREITGQIHDVYACYRKTGPEGEVTIEKLVPGRDDRAPKARDVLLAFEGGTGDKGEDGRPHSQSLMGFVLLRNSAGGKGYDVHIAFRGSRSGSASRAIRQALSDDKASGNPDWITDLGYDRVDAENGGGHISGTGAVNRGFARSMESILPQLFLCLEKIAELKRGSRPDRIYVTGHSLGGGLAQHFVSAVLLGRQFGPAGTGDEMPAGLRGWPWEQIKLITFGAPRAGDAEWAETLTTEALDSEFFSTKLKPFDSDALEVTDPSIVPRLSAKDRPAGYRVLLPRDPITTQKLVGGKHVGKTVYLDKPSLFKLPNPKAHEPWKIRSFMLASLDDPRLPATAWRYRELKDLNPERDEERSGSPAEFEKLTNAVKKYYLDHDFWFDHAGFDRDVELFKTILAAD